MSIVQGTKTFDEWLATDGKDFANDSSAIKYGTYNAYVDRIAKEAGLDFDESKEFIKIIEAKNS